MEQMDIIYSKGTEEIAQSMMSQIPAHHAADDNMKKFIYVMAETQAMFKLAADDLLASKRGSTVRDSELADMAENFNIQVDRNFMDKQKAFVQLASKWIDRKGTRLAFQTLISSYDKNSDISEIYEYWPKCGDNYMLGTTLIQLTCGMDGESEGVPMKAGSNLLAESHLLSPLSEIKSLLRIKMEGYDSTDTIFNKSLEEAVKRITPIHILIDSVPFETLRVERPGLL
jgi:Ca2+-binding EF-hand superfamily protein